MNNDMNKKIEEALKNVDTESLKKFASSAAGRKIVNNLSTADKKKLMEEFGALDSETIKRKLKETNLSGISGMSADEIVRRLKKL